VTLPDCGTDEYGLLPPSSAPYPATLDEIRQRFVAEAPEATRDRRERIFTALNLHIGELRRAFATRPRFWLSGGFVTHKTWNPRDADIFVIASSPDEIARASREPMVPLWTLSGVTARIGANGREVDSPKLHTCLGLTDACVVDGSDPWAVELQRRFCGNVKASNGDILEGVEKGFVEVIDG
jgi:hypothetical protein